MTPQPKDAPRRCPDCRGIGRIVSHPGVFEQCARCSGHGFLLNEDAAPIVPQPTLLPFDLAKALAGAPPEWLFRKKPAVIQARKFDPTDYDTAFSILEWCGGKPFEQTIKIPTLEGEMTASPGDWIVKGVKGEFYPVKPDIFAELYDPAAPLSPLDDFAQEAGAVCKTCDGTGQVPAMVETATGLAACPYIGEPCPACAEPITGPRDPNYDDELKAARDTGVPSRVLCVGDGTTPCGYIGGTSGTNCPKCGGMLLSEASKLEANRMTIEWLDTMRKIAIQERDSAQAANKEMGDAIERLATAFQITGTASDVVTSVINRLNEPK